MWICSDTYLVRVLFSIIVRYFSYLRENKSILYTFKYLKGVSSFLKVVKGVAEVVGEVAGAVLPGR